METAELRNAGNKRPLWVAWGLEADLQGHQKCQAVVLGGLAARLVGFVLATQATTAHFLVALSPCPVGMYLCVSKGP